MIRRGFEDFDGAGGEAVIEGEFAFELFLALDGGDGLVDAQELVVAGDDFAGGPGAAGIEEDEVFEDIEEAGLGEHAVKEDFGFDAAEVSFVEAFPFGEVVPFAGDGAVAGAVAVADDEEGVVVEGVGDDMFAHVIG